MPRNVVARRSRVVDVSDPVNRSHPLNRGRLSWWLTLPTTAGGPRWLDLAGPNHGALTNMASTTCGWRPTARPGGRGHLYFDGSASGPQVLMPAIVGPAAGFTAALSLNVPAVTATSLMLSQYQGGGASVYLQFFLAADAVHFRIHGTPSPGDVYIGRASGSATATANRWMRLVGTWDGTTAASGLRIYLDGARVDSVDDSAGTFAGASTQAVAWQVCCQNAADLPLAAAVDDVARWNRPLSPAEVLAELDQSRRGHPDTLNHA